MFNPQFPGFAPAFVPPYSPYGYPGPYVAAPVMPGPVYYGAPVAMAAPAASASFDSKLASQEAELVAAEAAAVEAMAKVTKARQKYMQLEEEAILAAGGQSASDGKVVGFKGFKRQNPMTDKFETERFHHMEMIVGDAETTMRRFRAGLGMKLVAKSDRTTGNKVYASYVLQSENFILVITSPYSTMVANMFAEEAAAGGDACPYPGFDNAAMLHFHSLHGLAIRAVGVLVSDATGAYETATANGAVGVKPPTTIVDEVNGGSVTFAEFKAYGDVVLRVYQPSADFGNHFLPGYEPVEDDSQELFGLYRIDHIVGNVHRCNDVFEYLCGATGWHRFAEFVAEDVGTVDSGLNSVVIGNNNEMVLMPINEPTFGTNKRSQIQIYLEHNSGPGVQHIALKCDDIVHTMGKLTGASEVGFTFMPAPKLVEHPQTGEKVDYYEWAAERVGDKMTADHIAACKEFDVLIDIDDQGILLQIFTKPLGDRPTIFIEIIQRLCFLEDSEVSEVSEGVLAVKKRRDSIGGCGGFGKGNFGALFKQVEVDMDGKVA